MSTFDDLVSLIAGIIGLIVLVVVLTIVQAILQIPIWVLSLDIPDFMKEWVIRNTFAFIFLLIGIPTLIVTKIKGMW